MKTYKSGIQIQVTSQDFHTILSIPLSKLFQSTACFQTKNLRK